MTPALRHPGEHVEEGEEARPGGPARRPGAETRHRAGTRFAERTSPSRCVTLNTGHDADHNLFLPLLCTFSNVDNLCVCVSYTGPICREVVFPFAGTRFCLLLKQLPQKKIDLLACRLKTPAV